MSWYEMLITYVIAWWLIIFMVLPWGAVPEEAPEPGHDPGAPARPRMVVKCLVTTVLAAFLTGGIYLAVEHRLVDFHPPPGSIPAAGEQSH